MIIQSCRNSILHHFALAVVAATVFVVPPAYSQSAFIEEERGDYLLHVPDRDAKNILVVAHGTRSVEASAQEP